LIEWYRKDLIFLLDPGPGGHLVTDPPDVRSFVKLFKKRLFLGIASKVFENAFFILVDSEQLKSFQLFFGLVEVDTLLSKGGDPEWFIRI
jgi:hypothetical protein